MQTSTDWLFDFLKYITGTSVFAGVVGWLVKNYIETQSKADLKRFELGLKHSHDEALAAYKQRLSTEAKSNERIQHEIILWANPILDAAISLEKRLKNILEDHGYKALDPSMCRRIGRLQAPTSFRAPYICLAVTSAGFNSYARS
jgi:hypothetical protein